MPASVVVPILAAIVAMFGTLGVAYAVFRTAATSKTLELYKGENEVQGKAIARQALVLAEQEARILTLERENEVLRNLVIGHEQLDLLIKDTVARSVQHEAMLSALSEIRDLLGEMWRGVIGAISEERKP